MLPNLPPDSLSPPSPLPAAPLLPHLDTLPFHPTVVVFSPPAPLLLQPRNPLLLLLQSPPSLAVPLNSPPPPPLHKNHRLLRHHRLLAMAAVLHLAAVAATPAPLTALLCALAPASSAFATTDAQFLRPWPTACLALVVLLLLRSSAPSSSPAPTSTVATLPRTLSKRHGLHSGHARRAHVSTSATGYDTHRLEFKRR